MKPGTTFGAVAVALAALASGPAAAQGGGRADPAAQPGTADRTLGGHVFVPELLVRSPFATTSFQADILYGSGSATGTRYDLLGRPTGEATYTFAAEEQSFGYEGKLTDGVSLGGGVLSQLYSGIDGPSVVVVGTQIGAGLFGRFTAGRRLGPVHAALFFDATYGPRYGILVLDAIEKALSDRTLDSASAFTQSNAWTLKPGAAVAWAPHPALGVVASADYQWVSLDVVGGPRQTESGIDAAVAADVDLGYWTRAPLALLGAWHTTAPIGSNGVSRVNDWSGGRLLHRPPRAGARPGDRVEELQGPRARLGRHRRPSPGTVLLVRRGPTSNRKGVHDA